MKGFRQATTRQHRNTRSGPGWLALSAAHPAAVSNACDAASWADPQDDVARLALADDGVAGVADGGKGLGRGLEQPVAIQRQHQPLPFAPEQLDAHPLRRETSTGLLDQSLGPMSDAGQGGRR